MDELYIEKWSGSFETSAGPKKFPVKSLWKFNRETNQIDRIAQWISFPWGGEWESVSSSIKPARMVDGKLHKIAQKHSHVLESVKASKILTTDQYECLDFLVKFPERGFLNYQKYSK
jgi:hypothetical protein